MSEYDNLLEMVARVKIAYRERVSARNGRKMLCIFDDEDHETRWVFDKDGVLLRLEIPQDDF